MWVFLGGRIVRGKTLYNTVFAIYISLISSITCMHLCNGLLKIKSRHTKVLYKLCSAWIKLYFAPLRINLYDTDA